MICRHGIRLGLETKNGESGPLPRSVSGRTTITVVWPDTRDHLFWRPPAYAMTVVREAAVWYGIS